jgi:hypothetical protein
MLNTQRKEWDDPHLLEKSLKKSLDKLLKGENSRNENKIGLSSLFQSHTLQAEKALEQCDKAMDTLANDYVAQMEILKESQDAEISLEALNNSETIWKKEASVIRKHDKIVHENVFLDKMRGQALVAFDQKLGEVCEKVKFKSSPENKALLIGLLGVIDATMGELGYHETSRERKRLVEIGKGFK